MGKRKHRRRSSARGTQKRFRYNLRGAIWLIAILCTVGGIFAQQCGWQPSLRSMRRSLTASAIPQTDALRVATWNLRNFPGRGQDVQGVADSVRALHASLVAVQEIKNPDELRSRLPGKILLLSKGGGKGHQRLGFAYDPVLLDAVGAPREHRELTAGGRVRPAFAQTFRLRASGEPFDAIVVHLKAMPKGAALRERQWVQLASIADRASARVIVLGDFNPVGGEGRTAHEELLALEGALVDTGLQRIPVEDGCSAYWDGPRRDAWKEPSLLDLIFVRGFGERQILVAHAGGHCAANGCESLRSTDAYPDPSFETFSDHCPVHVDLPVGTRDIDVTP